MKSNTYSLKHLVSIQGRDCHVQEQSIKYSFWDERQKVLEEQHAQSDQDVAEDVGQSSFPYIGDHIPCISSLHPCLLVSKALNMKRGVRQNGVHEGKSKDGEDGIDESDHNEIPVVGVSLLQVIFRAVDHCCRDILVHEE